MIIIYDIQMFETIAMCSKANTNTRHPIVRHNYGHYVFASLLHSLLAFVLHDVCICGFGMRL